MITAGSTVHRSIATREQRQQVVALRSKRLDIAAVGAKVAQTYAASQGLPESAPAVLLRNNDDFVAVASTAVTVLL